MGACERHAAQCYHECRNYADGVPDPNQNPCGVAPPVTPDVDPETCPTAIEDDCESLIDNLGPQWDTCKSDTDAVTEIKDACKFEACIWAGDANETAMIADVHQGKVRENQFKRQVTLQYRRFTSKTLKRYTGYFYWSLSEARSKY